MFDFTSCRKCGKQTTEVDYYPSQLSGKFCNTWCKVCLREYSKVNRHKYRERDKAYSREYCRLFPEKVKLANRNAKLKKNYGITADQFDALVRDQNNLCRICLKMPEKWHVDHCHKTGKVRGLLCSLCNVGLGAFKDDTKSLESAVKYLKEHE